MARQAGRFLAVVARASRPWLNLDLNTGKMPVPRQERPRQGRTFSTKGILTRCLAAAVLFWMAVSTASAADQPEQNKVAELIKRCLPAYVFVGGGSGAVISADGYVITNAHVSGSSKRWKIRTPDGEYHNAHVVGTSPGTDLCLMKMDHAENLPHLPLGNSDEMGIGDVVLAIGNPFALGNIDGRPTVTLGVVSALHVDRPFAYDAIQTDTPINPGNSGGPLINLKGELIGVNAQIQTRFGLRQNTGVGYAISSNQVARFLPALKLAEGGRVAAGRIDGVTVGTLPDEPAVVKAVEDGSDAAEAGIEKGDVIVAIDKTPVASVQDFLGALERYPIGVEVKVKVRRGEPAADHEFTVAITKHGRPYIGLGFDVKNAASLAVSTVDADSPAAKAGIKPGDVVFGVGQFRIRSRQEFYRYLYRMRPGMTVQFAVRRGTQNLAIRLVVAEHQ